MPRESGDWSVPGPLRALLWWPAAALVLVIVAPDAAVGSITAAGAVLAAVGTLASSVARRIRAAAVTPADACTSDTRMSN